MFTRALGIILGFQMAGLPGALLGFFVGYYFELSYKDMRFGLEGDLKKQKPIVQETFFRTTFLVLGYISKYDGHVSEREIAAARKIMQFMSLTSDKKMEAIEYFNQGKSSTFDLNRTLAQFVNVCGNSYHLLQMFIEFQLIAVYADRSLYTVTIERKILDDICTKIGVPLRVLRRLQRQFEAEIKFNSGQYKQGQRGQNRAHNQSSRSFRDASTLNDAYIILGVSKADSMDVIKKAYRRLMSQHHPDKLIAKGLPEDMVKMATQKSQNIQAAYDLIRKERGLK